MRWIPRHRNQSRAKAARISISQEEILADLLYPARRRPGRKDLENRIRGISR